MEAFPWELGCLIPAIGFPAGLKKKILKFSAGCGHPVSGAAPVRCPAKPPEPQENAR